MRKRKVMVVASAVLLFLIVLVTAAPIWYPWVLTPILKKRGVTYDSYSREGAKWLLLRNVTYSRNGNHFSARQIRVITPVPYLWDKLGPTSPDVLNVVDWRLNIAKGTNHANRLVYRQLAQTELITARLKRWVSRASLRDGSIEIRGEIVSVPSARWQKGVLSAVLESPRLKQSGSARFDFSRNQSGRFAVTLGKGAGNGMLKSLGTVQVDGGFNYQRSPGITSTNLAVYSTIKWQRSQMRISAEFSRTNVSPETANFNASAISIPAELVRLPGYEAITGTLNAKWQTPGFQIDLDATAHPLAGSNVPPVTVTLHGGGDTNSVRFETARINSPWMTADLSEGFAIDYSGKMQNELASFFLSADLDHQPWMPIRGQVAGHAYLRRGNRLYPDISAELHGQNIRGFDFQVIETEMHTGLNWPLLTLTNCQASFTNGAVVHASGTLNLEERSITDSKVHFSGIVPKLALPPGVSYSGIDATLRAKGPWLDPDHSGTIEIKQLRIRGTVPLQTQVRWSGKRLEFDHFEATVTGSDQAQLALAGAAELDQNTARVLLTTMNLNTDSGRFALEQPVIARFHRRPEDPGSYMAQIDHLIWHGSAGRLALDCEVNWPRSGRAKLSVQSMSNEMIRDLLQADFPDIKVSHLEATADWDNGPLEFSVSLQSEYDPGRAQDAEITGTSPVTSRPWWKFATEPWALSMQVAGGKEGVVLKEFLVSGQDGPLLSAHGQVSARLFPGQGANLIQIDYGAPLNLQAKAHPGSAFWEWLTEGSPFRVTNAWVDASLGGTIQRPEGWANLGADRITLLGHTNQRPIHADTMQARMSFGGRGLQLDRFSTLVAGQPVEGEGQLPLTERITSWKSLLDWRHASGKIRAPSINLAVVSSFAPEYLSPQGVAGLELSLQEGSVNGQLLIKGAASKPLPNIGPLQDVNAMIRLTGRKFAFENCSGLLGGGPVAILGEITIPERLISSRLGKAALEQALASDRELPVFDLLLRGDSVPLVRRSDFIFRAHFDVHLSNTNAGKPQVSGTVTLQNSFFLSDLKLLIPSSVDKPQNRPPFFSIEREPFAGWGLDVSLKGNKFLKVRSPFFTGVASANFHLTGTLKEPLALGRVTIDSGSIQFPFANLNVMQGEVGLTAASPYLPHLLVVASSRVYNYDVRAQITGAVDRPNIEFSSTPGLAPEQILVMLTTGEMPLNDNSFTAQQRAGHLAMFVGKNVLSRLGLNVGAEDRLILRSSPSDIEPGTQAYGFEYKLSKKWSVTGDYDRFGGVNLGLQWRFYSK